ncbi:MAG: hypothetical protein ACTSRZ_07840 [Promethearchaeota archaeon]
MANFKGFKESENNNNKGNGNNNIRNEESIYETQAKALLYIKRQQHYLQLSLIIPIICMIISFINFYFIIYLFVHKLIALKRIIDAFIPIYIFFIISMIMLIQYNFLYHWKTRCKAYEFELKREDTTKYLKSNNISFENTEKEKIDGNIINPFRFEALEKSKSKELRELRDDDVKKRGETNKVNISLTQLFYDIIEYMNKAKATFYILTAIFAVYFFWGFDFFITGLPIFIPFIILKRIMTINFIGYILLIIYMLYQWIHFLRWHLKHRKLKKFEKRIVKELNL